eukprot:TRINITY_DN6442_c0_g1_i1.p1 TRINITY_DN6442_c0_g1~~TRINITY_DN6442_c0_g1_i1.p1  ORF type:complete len:119 (-),score=12.33 TRINITY_DN6442_c0_g1_i1:431-787(-)
MQFKLADDNAKLKPQSKILQYCSIISEPESKQEEGKQDVVSEHVFDGDTTKFTLDGLSPHKEYSLRVKARSMFGWGKESEALLVKTTSRTLKLEGVTIKAHRGCYHSNVKPRKSSHVR